MCCSSYRLWNYSEALDNIFPLFVLQWGNLSKNKFNFFEGQNTIPDLTLWCWFIFKIQVIFFPFLFVVVYPTFAHLAHSPWVIWVENYCSFLLLCTSAALCCINLIKTTYLVKYPDNDDVQISKNVSAEQQKVTIGGQYKQQTVFHR